MNIKPSVDKLPIIQSLWIGDSLSVMEQLSIRSFQSKGHEFHLYAYNDLDNVPEGTILKDANKIITKDKIFKYKDYDSYAGFANMFRYKLLLEKGSWWVDTDVICLLPLDLENEHVFASSVYKQLNAQGEPKHGIENCIIKAPAESEIMEYCYLEASRSNPNELRWGQTGPTLLHNAINKFGFQKYVERPNTFCPISSEDWGRCINGSIRVLWRDKMKMTIYRSKTVHLWNELWRRYGVDKASLFPKRSIYEQFKRRYLGII